MKIVLAYLEEKSLETQLTLKKAKQMNGKRKYLDFLQTKDNEFRQAIEILSKPITKN